jgi:hypothetical protein
LPVLLIVRPNASNPFLIDVINKTGYDIVVFSKNINALFFWLFDDYLLREYFFC